MTKYRPTSVGPRPAIPNRRFRSVDTCVLAHRATCLLCRDPREANPVHLAFLFAQSADCREWRGRTHSLLWFATLGRAGSGWQ